MTPKFLDLCPEADELIIIIIIKTLRYLSPNEMSLQPFTLFSFNISACGFVLVGPKNNNNISFNMVKVNRSETLQAYSNSMQ